MFEITVRCFLLITSCLLIAGCGKDSKLARVSGKVSVNGQPVERGAITFIPANGQSPVAGGEIVAGRYQSQVPIGDSKVEIRVPKKTGSRKLYDTPDSPMIDTIEELLPAKYHSQTELKYSAQSGSQVKDWDLTTP